MGSSPSKNAATTAIGTTSSSPRPPSSPCQRASRPSPTSAFHTARNSEDKCDGSAVPPTSNKSAFQVTHCNHRRTSGGSTLRRRLDRARSADLQARFTRDDATFTNSTIQSLSEGDNRIAMHLALNAAAIYQRDRLRNTENDSSGYPALSASVELQFISFTTELTRSTCSSPARPRMVRSMSLSWKDMWGVIALAYSPTKSTICIYTYSQQ